MATDSSTVKGPKTSPLCQFEAILGARMKTEGPTIGSKCVWSKGVHIFPECLAAMYAMNSREVHIFPERFVIFKASLFMGFTCFPGANDLRSVGWSSSYKSVWLWSPLKKSRVQCSAGEAELQITTVNWFYFSLLSPCACGFLFLNWRVTECWSVSCSVCSQAPLAFSGEFPGTWTCSRAAPEPSCAQSYHVSIRCRNTKSLEANRGKPKRLFRK